MRNFWRIINRKFFAKSLQQRFPLYSFGTGTYADDLQVYSWNEGATLKVGSWSSIASGVKIFLGGEHRTDWVTTFPFNFKRASGKGILGHPKTKGDVIIGSDVWIGHEALIVSGVTIGNGSVVGARSVVSKDVPSYAIVAGNPARIVKYRFSPEIIEKLLDIRWWDWEETTIDLAMKHLLHTDIESFIDWAEKINEPIK